MTAGKTAALFLQKDVRERDPAGHKKKDAARCDAKTTVQRYGKNTDKQCEPGENPG